MKFRPRDVAEQENGESCRVQVEGQEVFHLMRVIKQPLPPPACQKGIQTFMARDQSTKIISMMRWIRARR
jgi:hypothetical protein